MKIMDNDITISVVVPAYNSSKTINRCIKSILNQSEKVDEIIVTNDGSTDDTSEKLDKLKNTNSNFNIKIITQNNKGIGAARNTALKNCKSKYIVFLDSDDEWLPNKILECKNILSKNSKIDLIYHNEIKILNNKNYYRPYGEIKKPYFYGLIYYGNKLSPSAVLIKKSILQDNNFFSENLNFNSAEDFELWLRILTKDIKVYYLNKYLGKYIINPNSITNQNSYHFQNVQNVMKYHLNKNLNNKKIINNLLLKNKFVFLVQQVKICFTNKQFFKIFKLLKKDLHILLKIDLIIFIKILLKNNSLFKIISSK